MIEPCLGVTESPDEAAIHACIAHVEALRGVDLDIRQGEITAIIGTNGAGKTSTLMAISGLAPSHRRNPLRRPQHLAASTAHHPAGHHGITNSNRLRPEEWRA